MTTNIYGHTAKIYQFPTRAETGIGENRDKAKPVAELRRRSDLPMQRMVAAGITKQRSRKPSAPASTSAAPLI